jgi:diguanylate cyclase (GGDEF)-like protein
MSKMQLTIPKIQLDGPQEKLLEQVSLGVLIADDRGVIVKTNSAMLVLTGCSKNDLIGMEIDTQAVITFPTPHSILKKGWKGEVSLQQKKGVCCSFWLEVLTFEHSSNNVLYVYLFREIHPLAYLDPLTKLPNRRCFQKCIDNVMRKNVDHEGFVLFYIDLDRFKMVNDTLGHNYGDILLCEASDRLNSCLGKDDLLVRVGGDEFIGVFHYQKNHLEAEKVAEQMLKKLAQPFIIKDHEVFISVSIGLCHYPIDGNSTEALVTNADMAMYKAKRQGKNQFAWFQAEFQAGEFEKFKLENHLRKALQLEQFHLCYQPQLDLETGKIIAVEALLRWDHHEIGSIAPGDFISIAEETGLIIPIGNWALKEACRQSVEWQEQGFYPVKIAVNLSPKQFLQENFPDVVMSIIKKVGMNPDYLILEITENMMMHDIDYSISCLHELKKQGIQISIDDFGIGHSSLSNLYKLPIDSIKIDRFFIKDIESNSRNKALTQAIISMAHALQLNVVAEGIETTGQLIEVKNQQCDVIQGFLFSKPVKPHVVSKHFTKKGEI